jgi:hypoxanthine phosphoribosyltransferase
MLSIDSIEPLIPAARIEERVAELARQIQSDHPGGELVVISVLGGSVIFLADLVRKMKIPIRIDTMSVSSYTGKAVVPRRLRVLKTFSEDVRNKHVLIVDDILDSGKTMDAILNHLSGENITTATLYCKRTAKRKPDYYCDMVEECTWIIYPWEKNEFKKQTRR